MNPEPRTRPTLGALLRARHAELIATWTERTHQAVEHPSVARAELVDHMPGFVRGLADALESAGAVDVGPTAEADHTAAEHGAHRLRMGFNLRSVVQEYDLLQRVILETARREGVTSTHDEVATLGGCITRGIGEAVSEYARQRDAELERQASEHLAFLAHELRNPLGSARTALEVIRRKYQPSGVDRLLDIQERSLRRMHELIEHALEVSRFTAPVPLSVGALDLAALLAEIVEESSIPAEDRQIAVRSDVPQLPRATGDARLLASAITNLVRNAVKFTRPGGSVTVRASVIAHRVVIEVEDECGGLPPGTVDTIFVPYVQLGKDRSGFGLGLSIAKQAATAHGGTIAVQDLPGKGCVFKLELPLVARESS